MTWNGQQGFQTPIEDESFLVDNMGVFGNMHTERGLTCAFYPALIGAGRSSDGLNVQMSNSTIADI